MFASIIYEMYRAKVESMATNPPDRVPRTGLWKVVIYEVERFLRPDKEYIVISETERIMGKLNYEFGRKKVKRTDK